MTITDLSVISQLARKHNVLTVCDNTLGSPYLQSPLLLGVDISLNSCG
jgi:cystathionine beta-lyase/cystathionine gamma-synthase